jgi:EmrB/QacA subfamily drug resistance transporter
MNATAAGAPDPASFGRWRVFPPIALGVVMATLDASVVNIALPTLQRRFATAFTTVEWVVLAYSVTITGLLLSAGRLADLRGRRRVYGAGVVLFTLASVACGAAPTIAWLIAARVAQGVGAALVSANGSALLVSAFPLEERGKALGAFGAMVGVGLAIGSPLGGIVIEHASWRWLFLVNLPLGALTLWLLRARVPDDLPAPGGPALDAWAAAAWCGALAALTLALSRGPALGWRHPLVLALFAGGSALLVAFAAVERRAREPMLPLDVLFGPLGAAVSLTLLGQAMTVAVGLHVPLYLEEVLHYGTQRSGVWNMILPLAALLFAPAAGRLADRVGARVLTTAGMAMTAAGFVTMADVGVSPHPGHLFAGLALVGAGQGMFAVPNASALLSLVPRERLGIASGLQGTTRNLGFTSGAALMVALMASRYLAHSGRVLEGSGRPVDAPSFAAATHDAYLVMAAVAVVATVLAAVQRRSAPASR